MVTFFVEGKLVTALAPLTFMAAASYAAAASSAVSKVPSQTLFRRVGSRISAAHRPHGRRRTPRNLFQPHGSVAAAGGRSGGARRVATSIPISWTCRLTRRQVGPASSSSSLEEESVASASVQWMRTTLLLRHLLAAAGAVFLELATCSENFTGASEAAAPRLRRTTAVGFITRSHGSGGRRQSAVSSTTKKVHVLRHQNVFSAQHKFHQRCPSLSLSDSLGGGAFGADRASRSWRSFFLMMDSLTPDKLEANKMKEADEMMEEISNGSQMARVYLRLV
ncbi:hypothetical protein MUK42_03249 [Musa troglodytarum]|uniref:Uncharacterized protein n=1 Tax=Musa troglodytarum TaxID=320322 RepID=A0A9E7FUW4_9LILI|nr:hypothetical protein MUK42_03249 [Musa troglodytarum]